MRGYTNFRLQAVRLRQKGYSLTEIAKQFSIAKSTVSLWVRNIPLTPASKRRLDNRMLRGWKSAKKMKEMMREQRTKDRRKAAIQIISALPKTKTLSKVCCSLLYWCEGNKDKENLVRFTNSDPLLVALFLRLLRDGFHIEETKFRVLMHLHGYHNEQIQQAFWQKVTKIPIKQFNKTYRKPNTSKNMHPGYPGCIAITYYDASVVKELFSLYNVFASRAVG